MTKCPYCDKPAELVGGHRIYRHRPDLNHLLFWRCDTCDAHVGCHRRGATVQIGNERMRSDGTLPLGRLANAELRRAKRRAHDAFDAMWWSGDMTRQEAYAWLADALGITVANCHIGMFDLDGCNAVIAAVAARKP